MESENKQFSLCISPLLWACVCVCFESKYRYPSGGFNCTCTKYTHTPDEPKPFYLGKRIGILWKRIPNLIFALFALLSPQICAIVVVVERTHAISTRANEIFDISRLFFDFFLSNVTLPCRHIVSRQSVAFIFWCVGCVYGKECVIHFEASKHCDMISTVEKRARLFV